MKSETLSSFWAEYRDLNNKVKTRARKPYCLWSENPFHPSLHFKCLAREEGLSSIRVTRSHRALGILDGDTVTWFWIGNHDDYNRFY